MKAAILTDLTRCIGCQACVWACKQINELPGDSASKLSATTLTAIERHGPINVRRQCMHCEDPTCASVCPVGALQKNPIGAVTYDETKCIGCRYCMLACPFDIPKYEWHSTVPRVQKCVMCYEKRLKQGQQPACTQVCPTQATVFGDRDRLLQLAHRRIRANPQRYVDHVYGEQEAGGTAVLYLSSVPFESLGFKSQIQRDPYPRLTWRVLSRLPQVVSVAGIALIGTWWIIRRRQAIAAGELDDTEQQDR